MSAPPPPPTPPTPPPDSRRLIDAGIDADPALGVPLSLHRSNRLGPVLMGFGIGVPTMVLLGLLAANVDAWWVLPTVMTGAGLTAIGLGWYLLHYWHREVVLYQRGFSFREGSRTVFFSYSEVKWVGVRARRLAYFGGLIQRDYFRVDVVTYAGDSIAITPRYRRIAALATRLTEQVDRPLRAEVTARWARGEPIAFSPALALGPGGLVMTDDAGERALAWADLSGYKIGGGALTLTGAGGAPFASLPLDGLYNHALLIDLLKREGGRRA